MDLFPDEEPPPLPRVDRSAPLAERMRPRTLDEFVGQEALIAPGRPLREAIEHDRLRSIILWGPPGTGKTTLARVIASVTRAHFVMFSAVLAGIKEIREVMADAEQARRRSGRRTILFIDEIHRFNKAQQDAFLPRVESGDIVLIGATTENPSFEVNSALLSRSKVYVLQPLTREAVVTILRRAATDTERGLGAQGIQYTDDGLAAIGTYANGDAQALTIAVAARDAVHFIGMPEGNTALAQAAIYLATAPKSNAVYRAYGDAAEAAGQELAEPVPLHLRNAPTGLMKQLDYGK